MSGGWLELLAPFFWLALYLGAACLGVYIAAVACMRFDRPDLSLSQRMRVVLGGPEKHPGGRDPDA